MRQVIVPPPSVAPKPDREAVVIRLAGETMGTTWSAAYTHPFVAPEEARCAIQAALDGVVARMSPWRPDSDLSRFNDAVAGWWVELPPDVVVVLEAALQVAEDTDGAFDPTLGALVDLWGFGGAPFRGEPPEADDIMQAIGVSGWKRLKRDRARFLQPGGLRLDLNGIAKGFAVDKALEVLATLGVRNGLVEIGGELKGSGAKPDGNPWWVSIETPPSALASEEMVVALSGFAVATSADHARSFLHEGYRYGHTLRLVSGSPRRSPTLSATVIHKSCMLADAFATAALAIDPDQALNLADKLNIAVSLTLPAGQRRSRLLTRWLAAESPAFDQDQPQAGHQRS